MIDRVEFDVVDQIFQIRSFNDNDAVRFQQGGKPGDDTVQIGDVSQHVVRMNDIGPVPGSDKVFGDLAPEEFADGPDPTLGLGDPGDVLCGFNAQDRDSRFVIPLQEIPVVAGDFDGQTLGTELSLCSNPVSNGPRVRDHGVGERREVSIFPKQNFRRNGLGDLRERAIGAPGQFEWPAGLGLIQLVFPQQCVGQRRVTEGEDRVQADLATDSTLRVGVVGFAVGCR